MKEKMIIYSYFAILLIVSINSSSERSGMLVFLERFQGELIALLITVIGRLATVTFTYRFFLLGKPTVISVSYNSKKPHLSRNSTKCSENLC